MSLVTALDLLIARIEDYQPTRDPEIRFRRTSEILSNGAYRQFVVSPIIEIEPNHDTRPSPFSTTIILDFFYSERYPSYKYLRDVIADAEELFTRISYSNSDQWGAASNVGVLFNSLSIKKEESHYIISVIITLVYNVS